jgi:hypothetical protein
LRTGCATSNASGVPNLDNDGLPGRDAHANPDADTYSDANSNPGPYANPNADADTDAVARGKLHPRAAGNGLGTAGRDV